MNYALLDRVLNTLITSQANNTEPQEYLLTEDAIPVSINDLRDLVALRDSTYTLFQGTLGLGQALVNVFWTEGENPTDYPLEGSVPILSCGMYDGVFVMDLQYRPPGNGALQDIHTSHVEVTQAQRLHVLRILGGVCPKARELKKAGWMQDFNVSVTNDGSTMRLNGETFIHQICEERLGKS
jgi:hypothetical protein